MFHKCFTYEILIDDNYLIDSYPDEFETMLNRLVSSKGVGFYSFMNDENVKYVIWKHVSMLLLLCNRYFQTTEYTSYETMFAGLIPKNEPFSDVQIWNVIYTSFKLSLKIYSTIYGNTNITEPIHILVLCKEILGINTIHATKTRNDKLQDYIFQILKQDVSDEIAKSLALHFTIFVLSIYETQQQVFKNIIPFTRFHYFL